MSLTPPSTGCFESREALIQHAQSHALNHGYAVYIKRSERDKFVYLYCDRDCPFELYGKKKNEQWHLTIKNAIHNYESSEDMFGHPSHHRLNLEEQQRVHQISEADCTYKTNKFRMPLLHGVGMTSFNTTFSSCFAFLKKLALMHAIYTVFPESQNFLCIWHIEKNVLSNFRQYLPTKDELREFLRSWSALINSKSEEEFNEKWEKLVRKYNEKPSITKYLQDVWLLFKKYFVSLWTDRYLHLGNYSQQFNSWLAHQQTTALNEISSLFQEPAIVMQDSQEQHTRGRPVGARNAQSSTRRDLSAFELAEPRRRKCVLCHRTGHNRRTCPNNNEQN
ncbi:24057_t:CDS:2 [Racocetra persica]|uniref:24057_t:CDS:1 n=1 Tax=Racocetra persica TaxID=160502 RepID=A0ACA9QW18_9GLOM|nr:24057_t:CDS:2 [Racocetra persica]